MKQFYYVGIIGESCLLCTHFDINCNKCSAKNVCIECTNNYVKRSLD